MRTGNWSAQYTIYARSDGATAYTNMPAADSFLFNSHRHVVLVDVSGMTYVRFKVNKQGTAGTAGSTLTLRYSPVFSTDTADYSDIGVTPVSVSIDVTNQYLATDWIEIDPSAIGYEDVYLAVIGNGGSGTTDPVFGNISASFC